MEILKRGVDIKDPIPIMMGDELVLLTDAAPMYVDMLMAIADEGCELLEDMDAFVSFVYQSFSFFERHWRKFCHDIRTGTLDKHVKVDRAIRSEIEAMLSASPERARKLDKLCRELGFYKNSGDSKYTQHSTPTKIKGTAKAVARRRSTPHGRMRPLASLQTKPKDALRGLNVSTTRALELKHSPDILRASTPLGNVMLSPGEKLSVPTAPDDSKEIDFLQAIARGQDLLRRPRSVADKVRRDTSRTSRPFVCSHPGCGKSFTDPEQARRHVLDVHKGRLRLSTGYVDADQRLHAYWPADAPWSHATNPATELERDIAAEEEKLDKPFVCPREGCGKRFRKKKHRDAHVNTFHVRGEKLKNMVNELDEAPYATFVGSYVSVPPYLPPTRVVLEACSKHWVLLDASCAKCAAIVASNAPLCPLRVYDSVRIDVKHREALVDQRLPKLKSAAESIVLASGESSVAARISNTWKAHYTSVSSVGRHGDSTLKTRGATSLVRVLGIFADRFNRKFVAFSIYRDWDFLKESSASLRFDFDEEYELVEDLAVHSAEVRFVVGTAFVFRCSKEEFHERRTNGRLPRGKSTVKFVRDVFSSRESRLLGDYFESSVAKRVDAPGLYRDISTADIRTRSASRRQAKKS